MKSHTRMMPPGPGTGAWCPGDASAGAGICDAMLNNAMAPGQARPLRRRIRSDAFLMKALTLSDFSGPEPSLVWLQGGYQSACKHTFLLRTSLPYNQIQILR
jgi:hypothetical protein